MDGMCPNLLHNDGIQTAANEHAEGQSELICGETHFPVQDLTRSENEPKVNAVRRQI